MKIKIFEGLMIEKLERSDDAKEFVGQSYLKRTLVRVNSMRVLLA